MPHVKEMLEILVLMTKKNFVYSRLIGRTSMEISKKAIKKERAQDEFLPADRRSVCHMRADRAAISRLPPRRNKAC